MFPVASLLRDALKCKRFMGQNFSVSSRHGADTSQPVAHMAAARQDPAMIVASITAQQATDATAFEISDLLETGHVVYFPQCPFPLPDEEDQRFLRDDLASGLRLKNISYHPEADSVRGLDSDGEDKDRAYRILTDHRRSVERFLNRTIPSLTDGWVMGTSSFRPVEEKGRDLKPHASNELIHFDAGAYGATNGDRILRFFVNLNPTMDRVWTSKGDFPLVYGKYGEQAGIRKRDPGPRYLEKGPLDHARTGLLRLIAMMGLPMATVLDSSPYDRIMRKFHNFMKDTPAFQQDPEDFEEMRFGPFSAWMVLTDMVSHAAISGQHALVTTGLIPLENCHHPEMAPVNILKNG
jgi:hypothetical protein